MSGGDQRKRVTFADLVTARLPTAPPPAPGLRPKGTGEADDATPPLTAPEQTQDVTPSDVPSDDVPKALDDTSSSEADLQLAPTIKRVKDITSPKTDDSSQSPGDSQSSIDSQPFGDGQPPDARRTFRHPGGSQINSQSLNDSQSAADSQPPNDRQPLREVKGYLKLANTVVDSLLPTLDVYEQAVFIQLYRLAHGFGNYTCKVSLPALQARTGVKPTSLKQAITRLQVRGVVEKISAEIGFGREQGITYWVSPDGRQTYSDWQVQGVSQSLSDDNKREDLKESKSKGGLTPAQLKSCPDCAGVGMWYPEGPGRGVARCYHPALRAKS